MAGGVLLLAGLALGEARSDAPANAGTVPSLPDELSSTPAADERLTAWTLDQARDAIAGNEDLVISVLGDSTGVGPERWVSLYAQHLSDNATVTLHSWTEATQTYAPARTMGAGDRQIEIWNGSYPGASWEYGMQNLAALQPVVPDLVIGNYGHNQGSRPVNEGYNQLVAAMEEKNGSPVAMVVTIQNPALNERADISAKAEDALELWVNGNDVPAIDVRSAFGERTDLLLDNVHPDPEGSRIWADTVIAALG